MTTTKHNPKDILKMINKEAEGLADLILKDIPADPKNPHGSKSKL